MIISLDAIFCKLTTPQQMRKAKGLSQQQLANLMCIPKSTIGRIEAGMTIPKLETYKHLQKH